MYVLFWIFFYFSSQSVTPVVQFYASQQTVNPSKDSDTEADEIQTQDPIAKTDFMKRMIQKCISGQDEKSQKPKKISRKEAMGEILKEESPKIDNTIGTSCTSDISSTSDDDIICLDIF